jgi:AcrR family transcriptional regulator
MAPKPDVTEERKEQIIQAATTAFARSGFSKTRMDDIAKESGLSKGALYLYFKSKDEIFGGILDTFFQRELKLIAQLADDQSMAPREKMKKLTEIIVEDLDRMKFAMPIFFEFWSMSFRRKSVRAIFQAYMRNFMELMVPLVEDGIASGDFRDVDAYDISLAYGSLIEGSMVIWSYDPEGVDLHALLSKNADIFLAGLAQTS